MKILLLNAGSSSLKMSLAESSRGSELARGLADWAGSPTLCQYTGPGGLARSQQVSWKGHSRAVEYFVSQLHQAPAALSGPGDLAAVGHRIVHGGEFTSCVQIHADLRDRIARLAGVAPLHNPPSLETLTAAQSAFPDVPQMAVFDTAFHATLSAEARTYAIPAHWTNEWGLRRFGFHGLSHSYCSRRAAELLGRPLSDLKLVICHLGHGCSAAAVRGGQCVETTMGFTPLEGLVMATRCGAIDPGVILCVLRDHAMTAEEVERALYQESGLLGVSGVSGDMRQILAAATAGHARAQLALAIYTRRVRQAIGALTATMGGIDALVFTAGVGERSADVRQLVCQGLECLGLKLDEAANADGRPDCDVAHRDSPARILVLTTREDVTMLREILDVLAQSDGTTTAQDSRPSP